MTIDEQLTAARAAQPAWGARSLSERAAVLRGARRALLDAAEPLTSALVDELGKLPVEARLLDVGAGAIALSWASTAAPRALATSTIATHAPRAVRKVTSTWRPRGVCGVISPWNYPYAIPLGSIAAALAGGNAVVWKPSPRAQRSSAALRDVLHEALRAAGVSTDVIAMVPSTLETAAAVGQAVIDGVDHVTFVGSSAVGRHVAARCGARLIPCIIEGGGKAPAIVLGGANVERAAHAIAFGALANAGQSCVAVARVFAVAEVFDALLARVRAIAAVRPLGRIVASPVPAEVVVDVSSAPESPLLGDECFAPVIPMARVANAAEAVARANAHPLQLAAYVFGGSEEARAVAAALRAPMVAIDDTLTHYALPHASFGGVDGSGFGRVHGDEGLQALCVEQVLVEPGPVRLDEEPWWTARGDGRAALAVLGTALAVAEKTRR